MGTNNRARRAAKAKERQRRARSNHDRAAGRGASHDGHSSGSWEGAGSDAHVVGHLVDLACARRAAGDHGFVAQVVGELATAPASVVDAAMESTLVRAVALAWRCGWQPIELVRQVRRRSSASAELLVVAAIAADRSRYGANSLDPRWLRQLDDLDADTAAPSRWLASHAATTGMQRRELLAGVIDLAVLIRTLPQLAELIPPPGGSTNATRARPGPVAAAASPAGVDQHLLDRVRNLLAKAESTEFEAEAEAFTAKAHELITRHAIDTALLTGTASDTEGPVTTRVPIDDPYADAKSLLLQVVAAASRCRSVFRSNVSLSDLVGFPADVAATELLFTSLLVQAQAALASVARTAPPGARTRSQSYRSAFLVGYANRIGQRLDEITQHVVAEAAGTGASSALPVLRSRARRVDDVVAGRYPELRHSRVRTGWDGAGWAGGQAAADLAQLTLADLTATTPDAPEPVAELAS